MGCGCWCTGSSGCGVEATWEETWELQRREDAGENVGPIPVPPKYTSADFRKASWWQARGKLDVPKERFILYPDAGRSTDPTPLLGWAGWDHAQQSLALSIIISAREAEGWSDDQLTPLVAGLAELQPWVTQWHSDIDPTYGMSMATFCEQQLTDRATPTAICAGSRALIGPFTVAELFLDDFQVVGCDGEVHVVLDLDRSVDAYHGTAT